VEASGTSAHARLLLAEIHGLVGSENELRTLLERLAEASRDEPVCEWFRVLHTGQPGEFVLLSLWKSDAALQEHYRTDHYARYRSHVGPLLARPSDVTVMAVGGAIHAIDPNPPDPDRFG
jgi:quinol monooxygenase YgiN